MTSESRAVRVEVVGYVIVACLAAGLRLAQLNWPPLTEDEARQALGAAWRTPFASPHWSPGEGWSPESPAYVALTRWVFQLGGTSEALARLVPALAGVGLVLTPLWLRPRLGRGPALMTSFVMAISPTLVTVSRSAGGDSLALFGIGACLALLFGSEQVNRSRLLGAAAAAGLALGSGAVVFSACLGLLAAYLGLRGLKRSLRPQWPAGTDGGGRWLGAAGTTFLLLTTSLGTSLSDAAGVADSLAAWLRGWATAGETRALTVLFLLVALEPLALIFGLWEAARERRQSDSLGAACAVWAGCALLVALAYPMRTPALAAWPVFPLSLLAGRALTRLADGFISNWSWMGHGTLIPVLLLFGFISEMQLSNYASGRGQGGYGLDAEYSLWLAIALLAVAAVITVLYAGGSSRRTAMESAGAAVGVMALLVGMSLMWRVNFAETAGSSANLWRHETAGPGTQLLAKTLQGLSQAHTGRIDALPVTTVAPASASMAWQLRSFPRAANAEPGSSPEVVIAAEGVVPQGLAAEYLGQTLTVGERRGWTGVLPPDPLRGWLTGQAPAQPVRWLLLVRRDLATLGLEPANGS